MVDAVATKSADRVVAIVGFMGAGKSTAARSAAEVLGAGVIDVDDEIELRQGKPIDRIFAEDGESRFRAIEEQLTLELLAGRVGSGLRVLALGGVHHLTGGSKKEGRVTCDALMDLSNCKPVELTIDGGATVVVQAGYPPIVNGVAE